MRLLKQKLVYRGWNATTKKDFGLDYECVLLLQGNVCMNLRGEKYHRDKYA